MKKLAILIPSYKRFEDLKNTLQKTKIDERAKFVIVANLEDDEFKFINDHFGYQSIIVDERTYGKLGGCNAYNLSYDIAKQHQFDYAMLYADDIIPFENNWLDKLYSSFIEKNKEFGIFSTDECHYGHYGWNIILDCPIAHFFVMRCDLADTLFSNLYKQYAIDFEIAVRFLESNKEISLLPIRLNHLRSGLHREFMDNHMSHDIQTLVSTYPKYNDSFKNQKNLFLIREKNNVLSISNIEKLKLVEWRDLNKKYSILQNLKSLAKRVLR